MHVCFALTNQAEHDHLADIIRKSFSDVPVGKCIYSSQHLVELLSCDHTDVLFIDAEIEGTDPFQCIQLLKSIKPLYVILLSSNQEYSIAYRALKSGVSEILTRPYTDTQISAVLLEANRYLQSNQQPALQENMDSRSTFSVEMASILGNKSIESINHSFYTTFQEGMFRVISFTVDCLDTAQLNSIIKQIQGLIIRFIHERQWMNTYDVVHAVIYNEIRMIFNSSPEEDTALLNNLPALSLLLNEYCHNTPGVRLFIGVGQAYSNINQLTISLKESRNAVWRRMAVPADVSEKQNSYDDRIIFYTKVSLSDHQKRQLYIEDQAIIHAINTLNEEEFHRAVDEFFSLPVEVLSSEETQDILLNQVSYFFDKYQHQFEQFGNVKSLYQKVKLTLLTSPNFSEYHKRYSAVLPNLFNQLSVSLDHTLPEEYVDQALTIIQNRYMTELTLSDVAAQLHLSSNYLSRIFHKTTGMSFSDYLLNERIEAAKTLLEKTNYRIFDISNSVGYVDQRYFSRIFMKKVGVTPSQYRKIHKAPTAQ